MGEIQNVEDSFGDFEEVSLVETEDSAELGDGGDDMAVWELDQATLLEEMFRSPTTNESIYDTPPGVANSISNSFGNWEREPIKALGQEPTEGEGGEPMDLWFRPYFQQLEMYASPTNNESEFPTPAGIINSGSNGFGTWETRHMGTSVQGTSADQNRLPLPGQVELSVGDTIVGGAVVAGGAFAAAAQPPSGIVEGENAEFLDFNEVSVAFLPMLDGAVGLEPGNYPISDGLTFNYGAIVGTVTNAFGEPVEDDIIQAPGVFTDTDEIGEYELLAPSGTEQLRGLSDSLDKQVLVENFEENEVDWQYPALIVEVRHADGTPVPGAPVHVFDHEFRTNERGDVVIPIAPLGEYTATVVGAHELDANLSFEGQVATVTYEGVASARVDVEDKTDGEPVRRTDAMEPVIGILTTSGEQGEIGLLASKGGEYEFIISGEDRRYRTHKLTVVLEEGEVAEMEANLTRRTATTRR